MTKRFDPTLGHRGFYGIGIFQPKTDENIGTLWRTAFAFNANFIFTIGKKYRLQASDTVKASRHIPLFYYEDAEDFHNHLPHNCLLMGVETPEVVGVTNEPHPNIFKIDNFVHPERCVYLLGNEANGLSKNLVDYCHGIVYIDTQWCLNVSMAGGIIMYDREFKYSHNYNHKKEQI